MNYRDYSRDINQKLLKDKILSTQLCVHNDHLNGITILYIYFVMVRTIGKTMNIDIAYIKISCSFNSSHCMRECTVMYK